MLFKQDKEVLLRGMRGLKRNHFKVEMNHFAVRLHFEIFSFFRFFVLAGLHNRRAYMSEQSFLGHLDQVQACLSAGGFQKSSRVTAEMKDVEVFIANNAGGRVPR